MKIAIDCSDYKVVSVDGIVMIAWEGTTEFGNKIVVIVRHFIIDVTEIENFLKKDMCLNGRISVMSSESAE